MNMKMFFVLISCFALAGAALAEKPDNVKKKKGGQGQGQAQVQGQGQGQGHNKPANLKGAGLHKGQNKIQGQGQGLGQGQGQGLGKHHAKQADAALVPAVNKGKGEHKMAEHKLNGQNLQAKHFEKKHFNLGNKANPNIPNVKFQANHHIQGSQNWKGNKYVVFKTYKSQWHDKGWWHHNHNHIVFVFGGWYFWDGGYWFPAWGYAPNAYYAYDGPIYSGSVETDPGQIVANVQSALQEQGYDVGEIDGVLGPRTRAALAQYQANSRARAHGRDRRADTRIVGNGVNKTSITKTAVDFHGGFFVRGVEAAVSAAPRWINRG